MPDFMTRTEAEATIPVQYSKEIISQVTKKSAAMRLFRNIPMSSKTERVPVLAALATAGFVTADTGLSPVGKIGFEGKTLYAEPVTVIIPLPLDVLDDSESDLMDQIVKEGSAALAREIDGAAFFSIRKPQSWPEGIAVVAEAKGNVYHRGTADKEDGGIAEDLNQTMALVENDGYDPNVIAARRSFRQYVRGARDANGQKLLETGTNGEQIDGAPIEYLSGFWGANGADKPELVLGDKDMAIIGVRSDITMTKLTEASVKLNDGTVLYLAQQHMCAFMLRARIGFVVADPVTDENSGANRFPFAVLKSPVA